MKNGKLNRNSIPFKNENGKWFACEMKIERTWTLNTLNGANRNCISKNAKNENEKKKKKENKRQRANVLCVYPRFDSRFGVNAMFHYVTHMSIAVKWGFPAPNNKITRSPIVQLSFDKLLSIYLFCSFIRSFAHSYYVHVCVCVCAILFFFISHSTFVHFICWFLYSVELHLSFIVVMVAYAGIKNMKNGPKEKKNWF